MKKYLLVLLTLIAAGGCGKKEMKYWERVDLGPDLRDEFILCVVTKGDDILVGTYGQGALFSKNNLKEFEHFAAGDSGLSWGYVLGGDWAGDYILLATMGDGFNISDNGGKTWKRLGYNFFGVEYLYMVGADIKNGIKYGATADGIVYFKDDIDPDVEYASPPYSTIDERQGLSSQYLYDMLIDGSDIYVGSLHGFSVSNDKGESWRNFAPNGIYSKEQLPECKVRAVAVIDKYWYAGCDDGLYYSDDEGETWMNITNGLPSPFVHDILIDRKGKLWVATYKGVAYSNNNGRSYTVFGKTSGFYGENINCLAPAPEDNIYAGTNYGLYRMTDQIPAPRAYPKAQAEFDRTEKPIHQWMLRPVRPDENNQKDQSYLYGATMGGNFRQHQGCEYNNPEGTELLAVDDGVIVYVNKEIGHTVLRCDTRFEKYYVYAHYHHMNDITRKVGQLVSRGDVIGTIGKKGNVTNEHLHFEVSLSRAEDSNVPNQTVNNELWQRPLPNCGTIVGNIVDSQDKPIMGAKIYGVEKPCPTETPFSYAESYRDSVHASPAYNENFVIADVPEGKYLLWADVDGTKYAVGASVEAGRVTRVKIKAGKPATTVAVR